MDKPGRRSSVTRSEQLSETEVRAILALAAAADDTDGTYPISEHVVLHVQRGGTDATHLLIPAPDGLAGYAYVDPRDPDGASGELVVHPMRRRHGLGRALVTAALQVAAEHDPRGRLRVWAHGDHPSASALALSLGFARARVLLQLRRSLHDPIPEPRLPDGVLLRAFRPDTDDETWLATNRRAFADHPEQGRWTRQDLRARMAEPWFDAAGFLLAVDAATDRLLGFHWTKVHPGGQGRRPIGEVYVVGVDPQAHGRGLGKALTVAGLHHLRRRGLDQVMLYVDESNAPAVALYRGLGFARWSADVHYRHG
ncbi:MAG TPA: mycothiol synthase [Micromonosporaceae bacterium]